MDGQDIQDRNNKFKKYTLLNILYILCIHANSSPLSIT